jgi:lipopolysaccharide biosynthesis protein
MPEPIVVALYLPQFHPIPENDQWWGPGFTEWTNVAKARPLYRGHRQPFLPGDLGFYDLRVGETREAQADLARAYGVGAFCYYHYWFGNGHRLLQRPFTEVLESGKPDFPFMLCWANQTWSGVWHGLGNRVLAEQTYPGPQDDEKHFATLLPAFQDERYLRVEGRPVFMIYQPRDLPNGLQMIDRWRKMARAAGLPGLYLIAEHHDPHWDCRAAGFDAFVNMRNLVRRRSWVPWSSPWEKLRGKWLDLRRRPTRVPYESKLSYFVPDQASAEAIPCVIPSWDNTPRSGYRGLVLEGSTPEKFGRQLDLALQRARARNYRDNLLFVKSWNEWAEGNVLEPSQAFGNGYLKVLRDRLDAYGQG